MLNLEPKKAISYTDQQKKAIQSLMANRGARKGQELWDEKGPDDIFVQIKDDIRHHMLDVQDIRCAFCETPFEYGCVHIEHFAPKWNHPDFLYEPLNLVCSCPNCNGFAKKGKRLTIKGNVQPVYSANEFKYVHPFLDDVDKEIRYKGLFKLYFDREHSSEKGIATIDMFHWDTDHFRRKRIQNFLRLPITSAQRRKMIAEILDFNG